MNRKINFAPGEFYHIYNRGVDKRQIFLDISDYKRFTRLLFFCNSDMKVDMRGLQKELEKGLDLSDFIKIRGKSLVNIGAFCLMPNHFHLLIHEKGEGGISQFLKKLGTAYSMYFNIKYERTGKLFERTFLAEHADSDEYLKYLFSYIHLNPAKIIDPNWKERGIKNLAQTRSFLENYDFSSYKIYLGSDENKEILETGSFPDYFHNTDIKNEIEEWLTYDTKVTPS